MRKPPRILSVAGSDSSGGAGVQADIKTITMLGGYAMTAITAITAQNTVGVSSVFPLAPELMREQFQACESDIGFDAIKIGMLASPSQAETLWDLLIGQPDGLPIVFDPVMVATSGAVLADGHMIAGFRRLMDVATLVTPNLPELEALTDRPCPDRDAIYEAAAELVERHGCHVLAKGGHGEGERVMDLLVRPDGSAVAFEHERIETPHTHGTGCTLSSAIATLLGHGQEMDHAVRLARQFVVKAIKAAPGFGAGHGPMGHQGVR